LPVYLSAQNRKLLLGNSVESKEKVLGCSEEDLVTRFDYAIIKMNSLDFMLFDDLLLILPLLLLGFV